MLDEDLLITAAASEGKDSVARRQCPCRSHKVPKQVRGECLQDTQGAQASAW